MSAIAHSFDMLAVESADLSSSTLRCRGAEVIWTSCSVEALNSVQPAEQTRSAESDVNNTDALSLLQQLKLEALKRFLPQRRLIRVSWHLQFTLAWVHDRSSSRFHLVDNDDYNPTIITYMMVRRCIMQQPSSQHERAFASQGSQRSDRLRRFRGSRGHSRSLSLAQPLVLG